jgi:hypothetical protein
MKKGGQRQSEGTLTFHKKSCASNLLKGYYFKEAPLATASLMFPTK